MLYDYRSAYLNGIEILKKAEWVCDPEGMFRAPSVAKGQPVRLECERLASGLGLPVPNVCEEVITAARIHHYVAICGEKAQEYFLSGHCPLDPKKIGKLSRRMPPFIRAKMDTLVAGSVNVVSNPDHAFDTDGWPELKRRLPKFRATMERYAAHCTSTAIQLGLVEIVIEHLAAKLQAIEHECDLISQKLKSIQPQEQGTPNRPPQTAKSKAIPDWLKAYERISQVHGVLQKTNRDLNSEFWKSEWVPTEAQSSGVTADVSAVAQAATDIRAWLRHRR